MLPFYSIVLLLLTVPLALVVCEHDFPDLLASNIKERKGEAYLMDNDKDSQSRMNNDLKRKNNLFEDKLSIKSNHIEMERGPLLSTLDEHPYFPPNKDGITRVNATDLLLHKGNANLDDKKIQLPQNEIEKRVDTPVQNENLNALKNEEDHGMVNEQPFKFHDPNANMLPDQPPAVHSWEIPNRNPVGQNNLQDNNPDMRYDRPDNKNHEENEQKKNKKKYPTAPPRPNPEDRDNAAWFEEFQQFALPASVDMNIRIRRATVPQAGSPWPMPQRYKPRKRRYFINPATFLMQVSGESCDILDVALRRTRTNTFGVMKPKANSFRFFHTESDNSDVLENMIELKQLNLNVTKECNDFSMPHLDMDESYEIRMRKGAVNIKAREVWGAVRGLETFSQLVYEDKLGNFVVNKTEIEDFPRFPHRGILLDTARHYISKETIIANLEAMAQNKMNVLHWHIVDEQSFPFQSKVYPNLTKMGAYDETHIYTHEVIGEIIEEARYRGIRVIPEFDTPGHTFAWGLGHDHLLTPCYDYSNNPNGFYGPVNPILKSTYRFLQNLFTEVLSVFKDKYMHLGGDEVPIECWENNPFIRNFIQRNELQDVKDVLSLYERKLLEIMNKIGAGRDQGSGYIVWQEVFDNGVQLKPDAIIQVWMGDAWDVDRVSKKGYRAIFSTCWYLDYIAYGQDWHKYYNCEQLSSLLDYTIDNDTKLIGGEACLWTEWADDAVVLSRLWPRASAAAERLWSSKEVRDHQAAAPRLEEHRCRMKRRGLQVGVAGGPGICTKYKSTSGDRARSKFILAQDDERADGGGGGAVPAAARRAVYLVDMNAMYVVPLVLVVLVCGVALLSTVQGSDGVWAGRGGRIVHLLTYPVSGGSAGRRGVRGLLSVFMLFVVVWCIWSSPMWLNAWENHSGGASKAGSDAVGQ